MPFPEGNQFWKLRSSHGRDKLFASPELLWQAATEYFEWCDSNPWNRIEYKGADIVRVEVPTSRPYTLQGLCVYCETSLQWWDQFKKNQANHDFFDIITRIEQIIYTHKFEGAAVGAFNPSIIARDLGLAEKSEVKATGTHSVRRDEESGDIIIESI
ncbi:DNA-packaging protein [Spirosoma oryzicola]|uniref:DNA-packaging protein n=1 Tax=Spirosoma oryzicola TaxID=2898794 RepID=UPI001E403140|nr:DNA-packaging protein [Spirosoma oryzicola]UHG93223.1 DNA-packaging protein [Spirosoma oryzicola]